MLSLLATVSVSSDSDSLDVRTTVGFAFGFFQLVAFLGGQDEAAEPLLDNSRI